MRERRPELYFVAILLSIDKIRRNIKNISYEEFIEDEKNFWLYFKMKRQGSVIYLETILDTLKKS